MTARRSFGAMRVSAGLAFRSLPELGSPTVAIVRLLIVPLSTGLFYLALATGGGVTVPTTADAIAAGAAVSAVMSSVAASALVTLDMFEATLPHVLVATSGRLLTWVGRMSVLLGLGLTTGALVTASTLLLAWPEWDLTGWSLLAVVLITATLAGCAVGVLLGGIGLGMRNPLLLANIAEFALPLLLGAVAPISVLPMPVQWFALAFPPTTAIMGGRSLAGGDVVEVLPALTASTGASALWFLAGLFVWKLLERRVRIKGDLDVLRV